MGSSSEEESSMIVKEEHSLGDISIFNAANRRSAFAPYRPVTVLTNLQRGNTEKIEISQAHPEQISFHTSAGMGELTLEDFETDSAANEVDNIGFTPLMWAAHYGQLPTARLLLDNHAVVDLESEDGETALLFAAASGHHEIVRMLLDSEANPNHVDHMCNSALLYAAYGDHAHCISELVEKGADITHTNLSGSSAYKLAVMRGCKQAQVLLEKFMLRMLEPL